jgi:uncharacterized protein
MEKININQNPSQPLLYPYHLTSARFGNLPFYPVLESFSFKVILEGHKRLGDFVQSFRSSSVYHSGEFDLTPDESLLDLLIIGVLWGQYKGRWGKNIETKASILNHLYRLRKNNPRLKPYTDKIRGKYAYKFLNNPTIPDTPIDKTNLKKLCAWLSATNEFNEEVKRIELWETFLEQIPENKSAQAFEGIVSFAAWFKTEAKQALGNYTHGASQFLRAHPNNYKGKEDFFFTGRGETEYHLNMVGAAIMNNSMKKGFLEADHKVLLLPSCMAKSNNCKAYEVMHGFVCAHCTNGCSISESTKKMKETGGHAYIVQHSSGFSKTLQRWANQKKVGLIGTACTLNLLTGGYEMKRLNIPAQCIFLDYSGCKKHWPSIGQPTTINLEQLKSIVSVAVREAV